MTALFLLLLYLCLPFIELGIIIALVCSRNHYKRIAGEYRAAAAAWPHPAAGQPCPACQKPQPAVGQPQPASQKPRPDARPFNRGGHQFQQGTVPFIIGVIFVILAGFIFATTTWSILPPFMKAVMVLFITVLFFGASLAAVKKLSLLHTGKAFYILGTIFLFVSTLAFGYFGLLGPSMTPLGENWQRLYLIGMVLTEAGLLSGLRLFQEKLYSVLCLVGVTVTAALFFASLKLPPEGFSMGMALFGALSLQGERLIKKSGGRIAASFGSVYEAYASVNLWLISILVLLWTGFGILSGTAALVVGGAHFLQGKTAKAEEPETIAFAAFLITGIARLVSPGVLDDWLYLVTVTLLLLTLLDAFGCFGEARGKGFLLVHVILGACTLILLVLSPFDAGGVNLSSLICMGLFLADVSIAAWKQKTALFTAAHTILLILFFHYGVLWWGGDPETGCFVLILLLGALFGAGIKGWYPFKNRIGEILASALILFDTAFLLLIRLTDGNWRGGFPWPLLETAAAVLVLTAVVWGWGKTYKSVRPLCLFALWPVLLPVWQLTGFITQTEPDPGWFALLYLLAAGAWDLWVRKEEGDCLIAVGIIGLISSVTGFDPDGGNLPFLLCLSAYLFLKYRQMEEGKQKSICFCLSGAAALAGLYAVSLDFTDHLMLCMLWPAAALAAGDLACLLKLRHSGERFQRPFWLYLRFSAVSGSFLYTAAAVGFYGDYDLDLRWLAVLAVFFLWQYRKSYAQEQPWWHLLPSLATLLLPGVLWANYRMEADIIYTSVMVVLVCSTALTRRYMPAFEKTGENSCRIDWFHFFVILPILSMCLSAPVRTWQFVYMLLTAGYFLQLITTEGLKKPALTAAGISGCIAFWLQPFITWPALIRPELLLIPAVCLIWLLTAIWGSSKLIKNIQAGLYLLCLGILVGNAFITGKAADALILEGICLTVFFGAYYKKSSRWIRFSGGVAVGIVLYMSRSFWLSLAWWVYLLAAGVGLILFAAFNEMKKRQEEK